MQAVLLVNLFSILIIIILLFSVSLQKINNDKTGYRYSILLHIVMAYLIDDFICEFVDQKPGHYLIAYIANILEFILIDLSVISFSSYIDTLIVRVNKKRNKKAIPAIHLTYLRIAVTVILAASNKLFYIDKNGYYQETPFTVLPYIISAGVILLLLANILQNRKYFSNKETLGIIFYLFWPLIAIILEFITGVCTFTSIAITLSMLIIFIMIQAGIIENGLMRESVLEEISSTDLLTGLNNRRSYYSRISILTSSQSVGVIFCDINGLKYINDNFGHIEGDKHIKDFSDILTDNFEQKDIFRISGDEFIIIQEIEHNLFEKKAKQFVDLLSSNNFLAAVGTSYGIGSEVEHLVSEAESQMYINKRSHYPEGIKRRN